MFLGHFFPNGTGINVICSVEFENYNAINASECGDWSGAWPQLPLLHVARTSSRITASSGKVVTKNLSCKETIFRRCTNVSDFCNF